MGLFASTSSITGGEFFGLLLFSTTGMMFLASANELLSLYVGLELTTIPLFVCAAFFKDSKLSVESGIKYLIIGAFSSAMLLYGLSFLYGLSGTTSLLQMRITLASTQVALGGDIGVILILANVLVLGRTWLQTRSAAVPSVGRRMCTRVRQPRLPPSCQ